MRLLITGARGVLGSEFVRVAVAQHCEVRPIGREDCDITNRDEVFRLVAKEEPETIIHCAAHTDVDDCERHPRQAHSINSGGASNFAEAARQRGARLVYISSSGIFDGRKMGPYVETDMPAPRTEYGRSKLEGENRVVSSGCDHLIVRASWLFGGNASHKKNFVAARKREAEAKRVIASAHDKLGSPTWAYDFALKTLELLSVRAKGVFHVGNSGVATRYDYVSNIISLLNLPTRLEPVDSSHFERAAPVPANEAIASVRLSLTGLAGLRPWQEALKDYIGEFCQTAI